MNKQRMLDLATILDMVGDKKSKPKLGFNIGTFNLRSLDYLDKSPHACGTVACIAGWAVAAFGTKDEQERALEGKLKGDTFNRARDLLDLSAVAAEKLFLDWSIRTPQDAARTVREMVAENDEKDSHSITGPLFFTD